MYFKKYIFFVTVAIVCLVPTSRADCSAINDALERIFLSKQYNATDSEWVLKTAKASYTHLENIEKESDIKRKLNFVENYSNFLLKLLNDLQTKDFDIYQLFYRENSFLKGYVYKGNHVQTNLTALKTAIEELQIVVETRLIDFYNNSEVSYGASDILSLDYERFEEFVKAKVRADISDIGYFLLEVFATLIGLSWGIISTVLYNSNGYLEYQLS